MSALHVPDGLLQAAGITEQEALTELAIRLFEGQRLPLFHAARLAGLSQSVFEDLLFDRGIAIHSPTQADLDSDLANLRETLK